MLLVGGALVTGVCVAFTDPDEDDVESIERDRVSIVERSVIIVIYQTTGVNGTTGLAPILTVVIKDSTIHIVYNDVLLEMSVYILN